MYFTSAWRFRINNVYIYLIYLYFYLFSIKNLSHIVHSSHPADTLFLCQLPVSTRWRPGRQIPVKIPFLSAKNWTCVQKVAGSIEQGKLSNPLTALRAP